MYAEIVVILTTVPLSVLFNFFSIFSHIVYFFPKRSLRQRLVCREEKVCDRDQVESKWERKRVNRYKYIFYYFPHIETQVIRSAPRSEQFNVKCDNWMESWSRNRGTGFHFQFHSTTVFCVHYFICYVKMYFLSSWGRVL